MSKIQEMTPIRPDMTPEEARDAMLEFLHEKLTQDKMLEAQYGRDVNWKASNIGKAHKGINLSGRDWVEGDGDAVGRFLGAERVDRALKELQPNLERPWAVAETRWAPKNPAKLKDPNATITFRIEERGGLLVLASDDLVAYSVRLKGDRPLSLEQAMSLARENKSPFLPYHLSPEEAQSVERDKKIITKVTGYNDFDGNANLRKLPDGTIAMFDTELSSFEGLSIISKSHPFVGQTFELKLQDILRGKEKAPLTQEHEAPQHADTRRVPPGFGTEEYKADMEPHDISQPTASSSPASTVIPKGMERELDLVRQSVAGAIKEVPVAHQPIAPQQHDVEQHVVSAVIPESVKLESKQLAQAAMQTEEQDQKYEAYKKSIQLHTERQEQERDARNKRFSMFSHK